MSVWCGIRHRDNFTKFNLGRSVGRVKCCWASPAQLFLVLSPVGIHDQDVKMFSLLNMYVFESGASSSTTGEV
jgi:hypothetical protein